MMRPVAPPSRPAPAPAAAAGPAPWGGWGLLTGGTLAWGVMVAMSHLKDLGITQPIAILGNLYDLSRYPGTSAGALLGRLVRHGVHLAAAAAVAACALGWGLAALRLVRVRWTDDRLRALFALGAGFALLGLAMLGGGLVGLWFAVDPAVLVVLGCAMVRGERPALAALRPPGPGSWPLWPVVALAGFTALVWIVIGLVPEVFYDSLVYHLSDPQNWVKVHKVVALPYNFFSNFPFTFEMLFAIGSLWGHDAIARLVHVAISLTAAGLIGWLAAWVAERGGQREHARAAGWVAALIYMTTPLIGTSASMTGIDAGLVFYESATIVCFLLWWQSWRSLSDSPSLISVTSFPYFLPVRVSHWLWLGAVFSGLGMGVKYTLGMTTGLLGLGIALRAAAPEERTAIRAWLIAIAVVLVPATLSNIKEVRETAALGPLLKPLLAAWIAGATALTLATMRRWGWSASARGVGLAIAFGLVAALFVLPWNLKAWWFTRNPVYPFAFASFDSFHVSAARMTYQMGEFREYQFRPVKEWLLHPWFITKIAGFANNSACGALFLAALPALLVFRGVPVAVRLLGVVLLGRYLLWSNVSNIVRYFAPGLGLLGVLIGAWAGAWCSRRPLARATALTIVGVFSAINVVALLIAAQESSMFFGNVIGVDPDRDFLLRQRSSYPCPPYAGAEAMNRLLPADAGALYVGDARAAFFRGRAIASTVFDRPVLADACREGADEAAVTRRLRQLGLTHVFFNEAEAQRTEGYDWLDPMPPRANALLARWWPRHLRLVWQGGGQRVYAIRPAEEPVRTASLAFVQLGHGEFVACQELDGRASRAMQEARYPDALAAARELAKRAPDVARSQEVLGQAQAYAGQTAAGIASFRKAVALGLVSSQVHANLAVLLRRQGRESEAVKEFGLARDIDVTYSGLAR